MLEDFSIVVIAVLQSTGPCTCDVHAAPVYEATMDFPAKTWSEHHPFESNWTAVSVGQRGLTSAFVLSQTIHWLDCCYR